MCKIKNQTLKEEVQKIKVKSKYKEVETVFDCNVLNEKKYRIKTKLTNNEYSIMLDFCKKVEKEHIKNFKSELLNFCLLDKRSDKILFFISTFIFYNIEKSKIYLNIEKIFDFSIKKNEICNFYLKKLKKFCIKNKIDTIEIKYLEKKLLFKKNKIKNEFLLI